MSPREKLPGLEGRLVYRSIQKDAEKVLRDENGRFWSGRRYIASSGRKRHVIEYANKKFSPIEYKDLRAEHYTSNMLFLY
jgi:hypothetical protein